MPIFRFSELAFTLDDARTHDTVFLNQKFPDLHRTVKALTLRRFQRQDFYCTLCERNDFSSLDDLIDHLIPAHTSDATTVMNTGFFVCTLCFEKTPQHCEKKPPHYFLDPFDLALHVFKFHRSLAEATHMKILLKSAARVELVTMHRTRNDEQHDDGIAEYLACTDDDVVLYPAANRVEEEEIGSASPSVSPASLAHLGEIPNRGRPPLPPVAMTHLGEKPKRGRPKGSKTKKRHLDETTLQQVDNPTYVKGKTSRSCIIIEEASEPAAVGGSDEDETGHLVIDEGASGGDVDVEEPASSGSGRSSRSDSIADQMIADLNYNQRRAIDAPGLTEKPDKDLVLFGRAIPPPPYRAKLKKKREELARAKRMMYERKGLVTDYHINQYQRKSPEMAGMHDLPVERQQHLVQQMQQGQSILIPKNRQWNFGQYHGTMTVKCPDNSTVNPGSSVRDRTPSSASNPSLSSSPPPSPILEVVLREEKTPSPTPPSTPDVPDEEDTSPKLPKNQGGDKRQRRAQIEELRRKRIAHRAKKLTAVVHEGKSVDPKVLKKISMQQLLDQSMEEVEKLKTDEETLLEAKQDLMQKRAALQKSLVEKQMLERSKTGLQRRLALR